jgi:transposase
VSTGGNERLSCLLDLYDQGLSNREIGERFGLSAERIRQLLVSYGVVSRPAGQRRFEAAVRGREEEIVAAYLRLGNEADVARETRLDEVHVRRVLSANLVSVQSVCTRSDQ